MLAEEGQRRGFTQIAADKGADERRFLIEDVVGRDVGLVPKDLIPQMVARPVLLE